MRRLGIRFGPVNSMTRKIYYKKIRAHSDKGASEFSTDDAQTDDDTTRQSTTHSLTNGHQNGGTRRQKKKRDSPKKPSRKRQFCPKRFRFLLSTLTLLVQIYYLTAAQSLSYAGLEISNLRAKIIFKIGGPKGCRTWAVQCSSAIARMSKIIFSS